MLDYFAQFASVHPLVFSLLVWPLLTAVVTGAFGALGHLSDDDFAKLPKPLAWLLGVLAASGLDAPKVLQLLASLFRKAPPMATLAALLTLSMLAGAASCKGFTTQNVQNVEAVVGTLEADACILAGDFDPRDAQAIAETCGLVEVGTQASAAVIDYIVKLLSAKRRAADPALKQRVMARRASLHGPLDAGGQ